MIVDVVFSLRAAQGETIPADHGYLLYGAVTQVIPAFHGPEVSYALHPVHGVPVPGRALELTPQSALAIRLDHELIPLVLPLAGRTLRIGSAAIGVGTPTVRPLRPAAALRSRLVVIKGFTEPGPFLAAAQRQIDASGVSGRVSLVERTTTDRFERRSPPSPGPIRRTIRIRDKEIVGFAVRVSGLSAEDSIVLQARGLGGRQHYGCGVLVPEG